VKSVRHLFKLFLSATKDDLPNGSQDQLLVVSLCELQRRENKVSISGPRKQQMLLGENKKVAYNWCQPAARAAARHWQGFIAILAPALAHRWSFGPGLSFSLSGPNSSSTV